MADKADGTEQVSLITDQEALGFDWRGSGKPNGADEADANLKRDCSSAYSLGVAVLVRRMPPTSTVYELDNCARKHGRGHDEWTGETGLGNWSACVETGNGRQANCSASSPTSHRSTRNGPGSGTNRQRGAITSAIVRRDPIRGIQVAGLLLHRGSACAKMMDILCFSTTTSTAPRSSRPRTINVIIPTGRDIKTYAFGRKCAPCRHSLSDLIKSIGIQPANVILDTKGRRQPRAPGRHEPVEIAHAVEHALRTFGSHGGRADFLGFGQGR